jgi:hypothetical protein
MALVGYLAIANPQHIEAHRGYNHISRAPLTLVETSVPDRAVVFVADGAIGGSMARCFLAILLD